MFTRKHTRTPEASDLHDVLDVPMFSELPDGSATLYVAMGCFWGAERIFWKIPGVVTTAVGYMGGHATEPTYEDVCGGGTGHTETVMVAYDPSRVSEGELLKAFWENHDPTTPNRQGNDVGTQYRSAIYWTTPEQEAAVRATHDAFQAELTRHGHGSISTEERSADEAGVFYYAEPYHQQYLDANPTGYCNHGPNGLTCQVGLVRQDELPAQVDVEPPA